METYILLSLVWTTLNNNNIIRVNQKLVYSSNHKQWSNRRLNKVRSTTKRTSQKNPPIYSLVGDVLAVGNCIAANKVTMNAYLSLFILGNIILTTCFWIRQKSIIFESHIMYYSGSEKTVSKICMMKQTAFTMSYLTRQYWWS